MAVSLPNEILCKIFKHLSIQDLEHCSKVSLKWRAMVQLRWSQMCKYNHKFLEYQDDNPWLCCTIVDNSIIIAGGLGSNSRNVEILKYFPDK